MAESSDDWDGAAWITACADAGCVEVAFRPGVVGVRDSKQRGGAVLEFDESEWWSFVAGVREGRFDPPLR